MINECDMYKYEYDICDQRSNAICMNTIVTNAICANATTPTCYAICEADTCEYDLINTNICVYEYDNATHKKRIRYIQVRIRIASTYGYDFCECNFIRLLRYRFVYDCMQCNNWVLTYEYEYEYES